jgi:hypothetical protein
MTANLQSDAAAVQRPLDIAKPIRTDAAGNERLINLKSLILARS